MLRQLLPGGTGRALVLLAVFGLLNAHAVHARTPNIGIAPVAAPVGSEVGLHATGLAPDTAYSIRVTPPSGRGLGIARTTDASGRLEVALAIDEVGPHQVRVAGPDLDALFVVRGLEPGEEAPAPAPAPEPAEPAEPQPGEPAPDPPEPDEAEPDEAEPVPPTPEPADPPPTEVATLELVDDAVVARDEAGDELWRFERPAGSGDTRAALIHEGRGWIAHGHTVFELELDRGTVLRRTPLSGPIVALERVDGGVRATSEVVAAGSTLAIEHEVVDGVAEPEPRFDPRSPLFTWWIREAEVADPGFALTRDDTNPHLHLRVAAAATTDEERREHVRAALELASTFYDYAHLARGLLAMGEHEAADEAMVLALEDFEARGYDPGLLTDPVVHERYGFPLRPMRQAVERGDVDVAGFWAPWFAATAAPRLPGAAAVVRGFADLLQATGEVEDAAFWREQARGYARTSAHAVMGGVALGLGRGGWHGALALLLATAMLHLTLIAKYWRAQSLLLRYARETGQKQGFFARWRFMRYYGLTEKLALLLMLAAAYAVAALAFWTDAGDVIAHSASAGHLEAPFVAPVVTAADGDPARLALVQAYRAAREGATERARRGYETALAGGDPEASQALAALEAGRRVPAPTPLALREAAAGTWSGAVAHAFARPFTMLRNGTVVPAIAPWAWPALLVAFLLVAIVHVVMLFVPRPRLARNAPRTPAYHVLSVLVPGSGAADELYGVLLLVPAALFGLDALMQLFGTGSPLGIPLRASAWILGALYLVNLVAVAIEFTSYRRRMRALRLEQPELAQAYGMRELRSEA